jgi:ATP-dependent Clp protease ATP-binding subunit ClpB
MVGAGKAEGAMDAGNMLKPALARGELHCVGATTLDEYRKYIEKDAALERRFQKVLVDEPCRGHHRDPARPQGALRSPPWRRHHRPGHRRRGDALASLHRRPAAARQGHRPHRRGGARIRMEIDSKPEEMDKLDRRIIQLKIERRGAEEGDDEASKKRLATLKATLKELEKEYADLEEIWKAEKAMLQGAALRSRKSWKGAPRARCRAPRE